MYEVHVSDGLATHTKLTCCHTDMVGNPRLSAYSNLMVICANNTHHTMTLQLRSLNRPENNFQIIHDMFSGLTPQEKSTLRQLQ